MGQSLRAWLRVWEGGLCDLAILRFPHSVLITVSAVVVPAAVAGRGEWCEGGTDEAGVGICVRVWRVCEKRDYLHISNLKDW